MKKILFLIPAIILVLTGCGNKKENVQDPNTITWETVETVTFENILVEDILVEDIQVEEIKVEGIRIK